MTPEANAPPTLETCIRECLLNEQLMAEYRRLYKSTVGIKRPTTPIEKMIDDATGHVDLGCTEAELHAFFDFVRDIVWMPVLRQCIEEARKNMEKTK